MDNTSEIAALLVPELMKINVSDKSVREAQKLLEGWDYTQEPDSAAAAYFNAVWRNILKLAFGDKLPKELRVKGECLTVPPGRQHGPGRRAGQAGARMRPARHGLRRSRTAATAGTRWSRNIMNDENNDWWKAPKNRTGQRRPRPVTSSSAAP